MVAEVADYASFNPSLLLSDQALHELGPFLVVGLDPLRAAASRRLGFGWSFAVQPGCTNLGPGMLFHARPMPTTTAALVEATLGQRLNQIEHGRGYFSGKIVGPWPVSSCFRSQQLM
jgi:hypothetical protein